MSVGCGDTPVSQAMKIDESSESPLSRVKVIASPPFSALIEAISARRDAICLVILDWKW